MSFGVATATSTFTLPDSLWVLFGVDLRRCSVLQQLS